MLWRENEIEDDTVRGRKSKTGRRKEEDRYFRGRR